MWNSPMQSVQGPNIESTEMFAIRSASSDSEVRFLDRLGDEFVVELQGHGVTATQWVSAFTDPQGLPGWFKDLASCALPWKGVKSWATLEGEFDISATCSPGGSVTFTVSLKGLPGSAEEWCVTAGTSSELGRLTVIAGEAQKFFESVAC